MTDDAGRDPGRDDEDPQEQGPQNPFAGTPFEQLFGAFGGGSGPGNPSGSIGFTGNPGGGGGGMPDLSAILGQFQAMMQPYDGPVNWDFALDIARRTAAQQPDPTPSAAARDAVADAVRLADHWLDDVTGFPSGVDRAAAWSRAEWLVNTVEVWKVLVTPVAERATNVLSESLPEEARTMAGPLIGMLGKATGMMVATQVGQGLGGLAGEVLSASDIGLPLGPAGTAALVPANVAAFAEGLDEVDETDVMLYLALREAAHQRLFAHVPWLRDHLIGAVADYARGIEIDVAGMEEQLRGIDPTNPASLQEAMEGGLFDPKASPAQEAALLRLETTLALVEGWVDEVVGQATAERMPAAAKLAEAVRRRRAAGGPAEQTFAQLVGLELRPRRLRDASTLWGSLRTRQGAEARDGVWMHPDLLPTASDLDDPLGFREGATAPDALSADEFDAELRDLLDRGMGGSSEGPSGSGPDDE
jgi:putative hydrolase